MFLYTYQRFKSEQRKSEIQWVGYDYTQLTQVSSLASHTVTRLPRIEHRARSKPQTLQGMAPKQTNKITKIKEVYEY